MIPKIKYTDPWELQSKRIKIGNEKGVHLIETRVVDCPGVDLARKTEALVKIHRVTEGCETVPKCGS